MEIKGLKPMSHYDFRKMIVLAKICPTLHGAKKQQGSIASQRGDQRSAASSSKGRSKRATETAAASTRAAKQQKMETSTYASHGRVENDNSDFNMIRLERSLHHLPEPVDNEKRGKCCALCRYATGKKLRANILRCGDCKTILCSFCYKPFHTLPSISAAKNKLCDEINERCNGKKDKAAVKKGK
jgi:ribosomal protein L37AE/L43A